MAVFKNIGEISHFSGKFPFFQRGGEGDASRGQGNADDVTHIEDRPATHNKIE